MFILDPPVGPDQQVSSEGQNGKTEEEEVMKPGFRDCNKLVAHQKVFTATRNWKRQRKNLSQEPQSAHGSADF